MSKDEALQIKVDCVTFKFQDDDILLIVLEKQKKLKIGQAKRLLYFLLCTKNVHKFHAKIDIINHHMVSRNFAQFLNKSDFDKPRSGFNIHTGHALGIWICEGVLKGGIEGAVSD